MLQVIRDRAQGWIAWTIVILIIIPFALWGIQEYFGGGREVSVATVNDTQISQQDLQRAYARQRDRLQQMLGENFRPEMFSEAMLKRQVLDQLVERELIVQTARSAGFRIGDEHLGLIIRDIAAFQEDGVFSRDLYERLLRSQGLSVGGFEAQVRRDVVSGQLQTGVMDSALVTPTERRQFERLQGQRRDVGYLVLPAQRFTGDMKVEEPEIQQYYAAHPRSFIVPERVRVAYLELALDKLAGAIEVTPQEVKARYEQRKEEMRSPEERRARHILIAVAGDAAKEADVAARKKAEGLLERLRQGESFEQLAKDHSDDPVSAKKGGDLGFFGHGMMVPPFEEAAFALKEGQTSDLVRSEFGYHIIQLEAVRGGEVKPFEEVRDEMRQALQRERAEPQFYEQAEQLANLSYEHPESLQAASDQLGLEVKHSELFGRQGGEGVASNPKVVETAFSEEVLSGGNNSEPIEIDPTHLVVLRVEEHQPESRRPADEVRDQIVAEVRREKAAARALAEAQKLVERLVSGEDPAKVAKSSGLEWQRHGKLARNEASGVDRTLVRTAFAMPRPTDQKPVIRRVELNRGDQAVVALFGVKEEEKPAQVEQTDAALKEANAMAEFTALLDSVRKRAEIKVRTDTF